MSPQDCTLNKFENPIEYSLQILGILGFLILSRIQYQMRKIVSAFGVQVVTNLHMFWIHFDMKQCYFVPDADYGNEGLKLPALLYLRIHSQENIIQSILLGEDQQ